MTKKIEKKKNHNEHNTFFHNTYKICFDINMYELIFFHVSFGFSYY